MNNENYIVIQGFMRNELNLKGNDLLVYALIYGFSQDDGTEFNGSVGYIAEWTGTTKMTVYNSLKTLIDRGLLIKSEHLHNGVKFCSYKAILPPVKNFDGGGKKNISGVVKKFDGGSKNFIPNNIDDNTIENNIIDNKDIKGGINKSLIGSYTEDADLQEALRDFAEMRKRIKKPMTERAWKLVLNKLDNIAPTTEAKIAVLNNAIEHCWQTIYPLKENGLKPQNKAQERLGWIDDI